ncbi:hypothetical protein ACSBOB_26195 [Mesorhizobium sp. ASY16-5R]|uniref:hypothetical protein n=1 Tax=Mesorhizobium sp. ASY16-5R TaxID=3445772 RepID=UPI003F9F1717
MTVGHNAYGLSCNTDPNVGYSVTVKMTPGLVVSALEKMETTSVFTGPFAIKGGERFEYNSGGFLQQQTDYCMANVESLKYSQSLVFMDADAMSLTYRDNVNFMEIEQNGRSIVISTAEDMQKVTDTVEVPLQGASQALDLLIQSCPKMMRQMEEGCGSSD